MGSRDKKVVIYSENFAASQQFGKLVLKMSLKQQKTRMVINVGSERAFPYAEFWTRSALSLSVPRSEKGPTSYGKGMGKGKGDLVQNLVVEKPLKIFYNKEKGKGRPFRIRHTENFVEFVHQTSFRERERATSFTEREMEWQPRSEMCMERERDFLSEVFYVNDHPVKNNPKF